MKSTRFLHRTFDNPSHGSLGSSSSNLSHNSSKAGLEKAIHIKSTINVVVNREEIWRPYHKKSKSIESTHRLRSQACRVPFKFNLHKKVPSLDFSTKGLKPCLFPPAVHCYRNQTSSVSTQTNNSSFSFITSHRRSIQYTTQASQRNNIGNEPLTNPYIRLLRLLKRNDNRKGLPMAVGRKIVAMNHSKMRKNSSQPKEPQLVRLKKVLRMKLPNISYSTNNEYC